MEHRKKEHTKNVIERRENKNGWCRYVNEECWFVHKNESEKSVMEKSDMIQRLVSTVCPFVDVKT